MTVDATTATGWVRADATLLTVVAAPPETPDTHTTEPSPARCSECDGAGFFVADVPFGHPRFGELIPCRCKLAERQRRQATQITRMSNLQSFRDQTFDAFNPATSSSASGSGRALRGGGST